MKYHLTFDMDWAPDHCIEEILGKLRNRQLKASFFVTHQTDLISEIISQGHTLGIHPNFLAGSSQGTKPCQIVEHCLKLVPDAKMMRTHALVQSTPLFIEILTEFPQIKIDLSTFTRHYKYIQKYDWQFEDVTLTRLNYNWEDDAEFIDPNYDWGRPSVFGPRNIYNFHPIHVSLNSKNGVSYRKLKCLMETQPLHRASINLVRSLKNHELGTGDFLDALIGSSMRHENLDYFLD